MLPEKIATLTPLSGSAITVSGMFQTVSAEGFANESPVDVDTENLLSGFFKAPISNTRYLSATLTVENVNYRVVGIANLIQLNGLAHYRVVYVKV